MKNTYIVAIKEDLEPHFIQQRHGEDITRIGKRFHKAYIFNTKKEAEAIRKNWRIQYEEKTGIYSK